MRINMSSCVQTCRNKTTILYQLDNSTCAKRRQITFNRLYLFPFEDSLPTSLTYASLGNNGSCHQDPTCRRIYIQLGLYSAVSNPQRFHSQHISRGRNGQIFLMDRDIFDKSRKPEHQQHGILSADRVTDFSAGGDVPTTV